MTGGHIFVGGKVQDLGSDAEQVDLDEGEEDDLRAFLDRYELRFTGSFKKIANAGKKLRYATSERQMRSIPFFTFSGASEYWNPKIQKTSTSSRRSGATASAATAARAPSRTLPTSGSGATSRGGHRRGPGVEGRSQDRDRRPERRQPAQALDAGDDCADELRGAQRLDQARSRPCLDPFGHRREHRRGRDERRAARRCEPAHLPDARWAARLEHPRHEPRRRAGDLHLPRGEARPRRPAHGEEGHARACPHPRHPPRHRPALAVAPPRHPRRRRSAHQGRGDARGDRVPPAGEREARGGAGERRCEDRGQGRLRLHRARRDAGLDRRGAAPR